jgi:amino acid transporter
MSHTVIEPVGTRESAAEGGAADELRPDSVGTGHIVFLVLAAAAPLAALVLTIPLSIGFGNGIGTPGAYAFAGIVLTLFAVGYAEMSRYVVSAGGFYAYVARGLGRPAGLAAAFVATLAYNAVSVCLPSVFGFFAAAIMADQLGIDFSWQVWAGIAFVICAGLSSREITLSARVLGVALVLEVLALLVFDVVTLFKQGTSAYTLSSFAPNTVLGGAAGVSIMYAFSVFIGFEATAIYGEEARDPRRTIARATYIAIGIISVFYVISSWSLLAAYGADAAPAAAAKDPGNFLLNAQSTIVGSAQHTIVSFLLLTSLFAAYLAFHQAAARYMYALGREGLLPRTLGRTSAKTGAPYVAIRVNLALQVVLTAVFIATDQDPYLAVGAGLIGLGTICLIALQGAASFSVAAFFWRRPDRRLWSTIVAPLLGGAGLVLALVLSLRNFSLLTGTTAGWFGALPWVMLGAAVLGVGYAFYLRSARPEVYAHMTESVSKT